MNTALFSRSTEVDWLACNPIGPHAGAFKRHQRPTPGWAASKRQSRSCDTYKRYNYAQSSSSSLARTAGATDGNTRAPVHSCELFIGVAM